MLPLAFACVFAVAAPHEAPRGNTVLLRDPRQRTLGVTASARLGVLAGNGSAVIQPLGFGFDLQFRYHLLPIGTIRFGFEAILGHTQFLERNAFTSVAPDGVGRDVVRWTNLAHTDFAAGPALQIPLGVLFVEVGGGVGLGVSSLSRPWGPTRAETQELVAYGLLLRGGGQVAVPIRGNQGVAVGAAVLHFFSDERMVLDPADDPDEPTTVTPEITPFGLVVNAYVGYQMWF